MPRKKIPKTPEDLQADSDIDRARAAKAEIVEIKLSLKTGSLLYLPDVIEQFGAAILEGNVLLDGLRGHYDDVLALLLEDRKVELEQMVRDFVRRAQQPFLVGCNS